MPNDLFEKLFITWFLLLIPFYMGGFYELHRNTKYNLEDRYIRWKVITVWIALLILGFLYKIWM